MQDHGNLRPEPAAAFQRGRSLLVVVLLAAHLAVAVLITRDAARVTAAVPAAISVRAVPTAAIVLPPVEPKLVRIHSDVAAPALDNGPGEDEAAEPMAPAVATTGDDCGLTEHVQGVLRADPAVLAALAAMPRSARSAADAVQLWDGRWADAASLGGAGLLDPIRAAVDGAVAAMPPACRDAGVTGPRLLYVAVADQTRVLAFGSGQWRWSQLIENNDVNRA